MTNPFKEAKGYAQKGHQDWFIEFFSPNLLLPYLKVGVILPRFLEEKFGAKSFVGNPLLGFARVEKLGPFFRGHWIPHFGV